MPPSFGMTKSEGDEFFPEFWYPNCTEINPAPNGSIEFDSNMRNLNIQCPLTEDMNRSVGLLARIKPSFTGTDEHEKAIRKKKFRKVSGNE